MTTKHVKKIRTGKRAEKSCYQDTVSLSGCLNVNRSILGVKRIVVPVDFSKVEKPALQYANSLACLADSMLYLVHVIERVSYGVMPSIRITDNKLRETIMRHIESLQVGLFKNVKTRMVIRVGTPFDEIVSVAREKRADLVVMSTRGHTGMAHVLLGMHSGARGALCRLPRSCGKTSKKKM